ncbi:hypothetical protein VTP01DRAFT_6143 [Rhizomucor pusillus]|uniref:uncharacterized protein n=1 Tax=Rhizomucor pusillus TaxID=4840 RepID=UPI00374266AF
MRILLRLHLAFKREAHYKELVSRKAKEKQERKIKVDSAAIRNFQRNRLCEEKKYLQNENRIVQAKDSDEEEKWSSRRYKCQQRIHAINGNWQKRLKNQAQDRKNLQSDTNEADNDDDTDSIKAAARWYRRRSIVEILEECKEEDSPDKDTPGIDEEQDGQKSYAEPSRKRLNRLKDISKSLIFSTTVGNDVTEQHIPKLAPMTLNSSPKRFKL